MFFVKNRKINKLLKIINKNKKNLIKNKLYMVDHLNDLHNEILKTKDINSAYNLIFTIIENLKNHTLNDNQILAALLMSEGNIIEMKTGEGKTYSAVLSAYINYIQGRQTFIIVPNDYLAKRDSALASEILSRFNIKVDCVINGDTYLKKTEKYNSDIIYIRMDSLIFDYLRDNKKNNKDVYLKKFDHIIIDEVDLSLIDMARDPLYLTDGNLNQKVNYYLINRIAEKFIFSNNDNTDFEINIETKNVNLTDSGYKKIEELCYENKLIKSKEEIYLTENITLIDNIKNALLANHVFKVNDDYIIRNGKIKPVDQKTGRVTESSFKNGLQQAIETYCKVEITKESNFKSMITIQSFVKKFNYISGMTGTISNDEKEIKDVYNIEVYKINSAKPNVRNDLDDLLFYNEDIKFNYLINKIEEINKTGRPILVGTLNIDDSIKISNKLLELNITHTLLNAKNHEKESEIIKNAGLENAITIATNMAGRGTDIILGGDPESFEDYNSWLSENKKVNNLGGLFVIGYSRALTKRYDDQLIGRSGRQGDNGTTQFLISIDDNVFQIFDNKAKQIFESLNIKEDAVNNVMLSAMIRKTQKRIESGNYDQRKSLFEYDKVNEEIREIYFEIRKSCILKNDVISLVLKIISPFVNKKIESFFPVYYDDKTWKIKDLKDFLNQNNININIDEILKDKNMDLIKNNILVAIINHYESNLSKIKKSNILLINNLVRENIIDIIDYEWQKIIQSLNLTKQQVQMRKSINKIPIDEYKKELLLKIDLMLFNLSKELILFISHLDDNLNNFKTEYDLISFNSNSLLNNKIKTGLSFVVNIGF